ncbi:MAG: hypothetical protein LBN38_04265 [Verrucomicrobiota bacterium]|jgi:carboxyl-terminal processing protease|nr:hypothetical protein [Verrucomicrobiota bacterium]
MKNGMRWMVLAFFATMAGIGAAGREIPMATESEKAGWCQAAEEGMNLLRANRLEPEDATALRQAVLEAVLRAGDPSVTFYTQAEWEDLQAQTARREWDTGLTLTATEGLPKVTAVRQDSPVASAGVVVGEWVEKIGTEDILSGGGLHRIRRLLAEGPDAALELGIRGADGTSRTLVLERALRMDSSLADVEILPANMGYVRAVGIFEGAGREIAEALAQWQGTHVFGAILDLRGAAGFAEAEIPAVAAVLAPMGRTLYTVFDRMGLPQQTVPASSAAAQATPLMVLVDEQTTAAAELLAAVLGGSIKGTMVIGRETSGNPLVREPVSLSSGGVALLAVRKITTEDGTVYDGARGIQPDVYITDAALEETVFEPEAPLLRRGKPMSEEEKEDMALRDRTRNDTYLRRATDVLLGLKALGYDTPR